MRFESCLAVLLISLVVFASASNDDDDDDNNLHILAVRGKILHLKHREDKRNSSDDATEKRSKRSLSSSERNTVLSNFNYQRSLVGASDMNYLDYDTALEVDLSNWTRHCNYEADVYSDYDGYILAALYRGYPGHAKEINDIFSDSETNVFNTVRSRYVTGVAGSVDYCSRVTVDGIPYYGVYLRVYGLMSQSGLLNGNVRQYTLGPACTRCQPNIAWCYNNLCRDDCTMSIYGCCQISNGVQTTVCATKSDSGASGIQAIGTAILHGLLLIICYCFQ